MDELFAKMLPEFDYARFATWLDSLENLADVMTLPCVELVRELAPAQVPLDVNGVTVDPPGQVSGPEDWAPASLPVDASLSANQSVARPAPEIPVDGRRPKPRRPRKRRRPPRERH